MKSYIKQHQYLKQRYSDTKNIKNHPQTCEKNHTFCNLEYEWSDAVQNKELLSFSINQSIPNIELPKNVNPNTKSAIMPNNKHYQQVTEQQLDDWIAQSMNRNLKSLLNPQKKFYIPQQLQDDFRSRYKKKSFSKGQDDIYFTDKVKNNRRGGYSFTKKNKIEANDLIFDASKLEPKNFGGTPIRLRQCKNKKREIMRRNAVFLDNDLHYGKFVKELVKITDKKGQKKDEQVFLTQTDSMFYSFNLDNLKRKSYRQETPSSITQKQFKRFQQLPKDYLMKKKQFMIEEEKVNENFRQKVNESVTSIQGKISGFFMKKNTNKNTTSSILSEKKSNAKQKLKQYSVRQKSSIISASKIDAKSIAKDKVLENKVLNLLNDMQIISESIDYEMSQLDIHVAEVMLKTVDNRPQSKWAVKGQQKLIEGQIQLAIDCYKQALIIQPQFFVPIFNIAVLLERQKMYFQARKWFQICKQFEIDDENVSFGIALIDLKQTKFIQCFQLIDSLIKKYENNKKQAKFVYYYIRALCCKKLKKFDQARIDFGLVAKNSKPSNFDYLAQFVCGITFSKIRRLNLKFDCLSYINFKQTLKLLDFPPDLKLRPQVNQEYKSLAKKLQDKPFFKRFSISLIQKILKNSKFQTVKPEKLIFINDEQTAIILSGMVIVKNYLNKVERPSIVHFLQQGGVIGGGKIDNGINEKSNNWFLTKTDVELIKIQRKSFCEFWKGQITFQFDFKYNFIKNVGLFKNLPEATLFNICQLVQKVTFQQGHILFNDCSYRNQFANKNGTGFGLGKTKKSIDPRFINISKVSSNSTKKKGKYRLTQIIKKNFFKLDELKFNKFRYPGIFILLKGKIQVQDDRGFRCSDLIGEREYFGQNLVIQSDGFHNYGRMVVNSQKAELYLLSVEKIIWAFTKDDKLMMKENSKNRASIDIIRSLRDKFKQCQNYRINYQKLLQKNNS